MIVRVLICVLLGMLSGCKFFEATHSSPPENIDSHVIAVNVAGVFQKCQTCHRPGGQGGFDHMDPERLITEGYVIPGDAEASSLFREITSRNMPPGQPLSPDEIEYVRQWINSLSADEPPPNICDSAAPGKSPLRKLTADEYENTVRDLFYVNNLEVVSLLSNDPRSEEGFTNNGDAQSINDSNTEQLFATAYAVSNASLEAKWPPPANPVDSDLFVCSTGTDACINDNLNKILPRAFRKKVLPPQITAYRNLFKSLRAEGNNVRESWKHLIVAILMDPNFLFLDFGNTNTQAGTQPLTAYQFANRLSYFLWRTMPDTTLFNLAEDGRLLQSSVLETQVNRMLSSQKAKAFYQHFPKGWLKLQVELIGFTNTDMPATLINDSYKEVEAYFKYMVTSNRPMKEAYWSNYAWLNARLASHYGLSQPASGNALRKVTLNASSNRTGGFLTMLATLSSHTYSDRTTPSARGAFFLSLADIEPPPPPDNVVDNLGAQDETLSLRERLELHRTDPACAACHRHMDPLGLGFENYNQFGAWRDVDESQNSIDPSGVLFEESFATPQQLLRLIQENRAFIETLSHRLFSYALSRSLSPEDNCLANKVLENNYANERSLLKDFIKRLVKSELFKSTKGDQ